MKIKNKTKWCRKDLKKFFYRCIKEYRKQSKNEKKTNIRIEVTYSKENGYSGVARLNGTWMKLRLPKKEINNIALAKLFIHEYEHNLGYGHRATTRYWGADDDTLVGIYKIKEWAGEYKINEVVKLPKPKEDLQVIRYNQVIRKLEKKQKALKRLQKLIKKWSAKKRYYERMLMAAGKIKGDDVK